MSTLLKYFEQEDNNLGIYAFEVGDAIIQVHKPTDEQVLYLRDVFYPTASENNISGAIPVRMQGIERSVSPSEIDELVSRGHIVLYKDGYYHGEISSEIKFIANPTTGFVNFTTQNGREIFHRFVGTGTKYAIASYTKAHVFWEFYRKHPELMVSHSSSIKHTPSDSGIVLSTSDRGDRNNRTFGKTTVALSMITRDRNKFAFCSNDEVIITSDQGHLSPFAFPNEISIMGSGLSSMFSKSRLPDLLTWNEKDLIRQDTRYYTTHGGLARAQYQVSGLPNIVFWAFIDLRLDNRTCHINELRPIDAFDKFDNTLFDDRILLARSRAKHLGEMASQLGVEVSNKPEIDTRYYFEMLVASGVRFIEITGSVDPDLIFESVSKIF